MKIAILNTSILTNDGEYKLESISLEQAINLISGTEEIDSAIGHEATAQILTTLLGVSILVNRQNFAQQIGQKALVFKLNGRTLEGQILDIEQLKTIGYSFKLLTRTA